MESEKFQELMLAQFAQMNQRFDHMDQRFDHTDFKLAKIEIMQEKMGKNIQLIAEGLASHREQNDRQYNELKEFIGIKTNLLESVVRNSNVVVKEKSGIK